MRFQDEIVSAVQVASGGGCLRLLHELIDLVFHVLLAGAELASFDFLQVFFGRNSKLFRRAFMFGGRAACELDRRFVRSSVADNFLGRWTGLRGGGSFPELGAGAAVVQFDVLAFLRW